jgi:hypothetical protein
LTGDEAAGPGTRCTRTGRAAAFCANRVLQPVGDDLPLLFAPSGLIAIEGTTTILTVKRVR